MSSKKKKNTPCSVEDQELFHRFIETQTGPDKDEKEKSHPTRIGNKPAVVKDTGPTKATTFSDALEETLSDPELFRKRDDIRQSKKESKRAKPRDNDSPGAVLDLHACTLDNALARTELFITQCRLKRYAKVLVIHGKGSGVLLEGIRKYLSQHPFVSQFEDAPRHLGGSGAVIVTLRVR